MNRRKLSKAEPLEWMGNSMGSAGRAASWGFYDDAGNLRVIARGKLRGAWEGSRYDLYLAGRDDQTDRPFRHSVPMATAIKVARRYCSAP